MEMLQKKSDTARRLIELADKIHEVREIEDILFDTKSKKIFNTLQKRGIHSVPRFISEFVKLDSEAVLAC